MSLDSPPRPKSERHVRAGKASAVARWGPDGRIVRLDELDPVTRDIVTTILRARREAADAASGKE